MYSADSQRLKTDSIHYLHCLQIFAPCKMQTAKCRQCRQPKTNYLHCIQIERPPAKCCNLFTIAYIAYNTYSLAAVLLYDRTARKQNAVSFELGGG